jgi:hypothetical protein
LPSKKIHELFSPLTKGPTGLDDASSVSQNKKGGERPFVVFDPKPIPLAAAVTDVARVLEFVQQHLKC